MRSAAVVAGLLSWLAASSPGREAGASPRASRVPTRYDPYFRKFSKHYFGIDFDWRYFKAQAMAESGLHPGAVSSAGARGIMQLMPSTFAEIQSTKPHYTSIDDPQWNIGAGIVHDHYLYSLWADQVPEDDCRRFMFGAYNAGEVTIARAQGVARKALLDPNVWVSVELVAPRVRHWRYRETLGYVREIEGNYEFLHPPPAAQSPDRSGN